MTGGEKSAARLRKLIEINRLLMGALEPDELLHVILDAVTDLFDAEGCSIALVDEAERKLVFSTAVGRVKMEQFRLELGQGIAGYVAESAEPVIANDVSKDPRFYSGVDQASGFRTRSILCVPLRQRDEVIGSVEALNTATPGGFTEEDLELLTAFAGLAATAIDRSKVFARLRNSHAALHEAAEGRYGFVVGQTPAMCEVVETARAAAASRATVLLLGESGVGKEIVARAIHRWSPRADGPFVPVNCVALSPQLLESELFGHEKGAFTGAIAQRKGKFEVANGGTIFLDEIGDLAPDLQAKLLRVLQEREFQRVGGVKDVRVDVRVIAATNRDLRAAVDEGRFRDDLFYRLNVVTLTIPPLRERRGDIPELVESFLARYGREMGRPRLRLAEDAMAWICSQDWPGNVRQLQNAVERAVVLAAGDTLTEQDFVGNPSPRRARGSAADGAAIDESLPLPKAIDAFTVARIRRALDRAGGDPRRAAELLGVPSANLARLMKSFGLK